LSASGRVVLVTGGAGFIGSAVVRRLIAHSDATVVNVDKLTYAANLRNVESVASHPRYRFVKADICDADAMAAVFREYAPDHVLHLAAESHVDRSIHGPRDFLRTNVDGTFVMLNAALEHWRRLSPAGREAFRFLHVSTDEVFGALGADGQFCEDSPYRPNSPYSASKAASDHFVRAWHHTYGLPTIISNCSNNYGPYQFPEKLIPLMIANAIDGLPLPVYARGENVRDWLFVDDHARALCLMAERGVPGECYCIGGNSERRNIDVVRQICSLLDMRKPRSDGKAHAHGIAFVDDRPGHDLRYAIDAAKIERTLSFSPSLGFDEGLAATVQWYLDNQDWWRPLRARAQIAAVAGR